MSDFIAGWWTIRVLRPGPTTPALSPPIGARARRLRPRRRHWRHWRRCRRGSATMPARDRRLRAPRLRPHRAAPATPRGPAWVDRATGVARLRARGRAISVVVEGGGTEWFVTLRGRRIAVSVLSRREQL